MPTPEETAANQKAAADKAAADKAAADKAKADADAKAGANGAGDDAGELDRVFDDGKGDDDKGKGRDKNGADLSFTVPDDMKELYPSDVTAAFTKKARELGLSKEQFAGFMAHEVEARRAADKAREAQSETEAQEIALAWKREIATDPQLGGAKLKESLKVAEAGARALGGQALAAALAKHLRGEEVIDAPMLIRAFHLAGLTNQEDRLGDHGEKPKGDAQLSTKERRDRKAYPETYKQLDAQKGA